MADRTVRAIFEAKVDRAQKSISGLASTVDQADKKLDALAKSMKGLDKITGKPKVEVAIEGAEKDLDRLTKHLEDLNSRDVTPEVAVEIGRTEMKIGQVEDRLDALHRIKAEVEVAADTGSAEADLDQVEDAARRLDGADASVDVTADTGSVKGDLADVQGRVDSLDGDGATVRVDADTSGAEGPLDDLSDQIDGLGDGAGDGIGDSITGALRRLAGKASIAGIAAGTGTAIGSTIAKGIERELNVDFLAAGAGMDTASAEAAGRAAGEAYRNGFGETEQELTAILQQAWRAGIIDSSTTEEAMSSFLAQATTAADLWETDMSVTVEAIGGMLRNGLAGDATEAFNVIYALQQKVSGDDLLDTFREYSVQFQTLGIDAETAGGIMAQAFSAGAYDTDKIADSVKELGVKIREVKEDTEPTAVALTDLGLSWEQIVAGFNEGGPAAAQAMDAVLDAMREAEAQGTLTGDIITNLFGSPGEDLGKAALLALDIDQASAALEAMGYSATFAADQVDLYGSNAATTIESTKRQLTDFGNIAETAYSTSHDANMAFADALGGTATEAEYAGAAVGRMVGGLADVAGEAENAAESESEFTAATEDTNEALDEQRDLLDDVISARAELAGRVMTAAEAEGEFHAALRDANEALKENGANLDATTEKGLENLEALHGVADAAWDQMSALEAVGGSQEDLQAKMGELRQSFIDQAVAFGMTQEEAASYADSLGLIPEEVTSTAVLDTTFAESERIAFQKALDATEGTVTINGDPSTADGVLQTLIDNIDSETGTVMINGRTMQAEKALSYIIGEINAGRGNVTIGARNNTARTLSQALSNINGKTGYININAVDNASAKARKIAAAISSTSASIKIYGQKMLHDGGFVPAPQRLPGRASGGWVPGPTHPTGDNVLWPTSLPGLASGGFLSQPLNGGEYVVNARAAAENAQLLQAINAGQTIAANASGGTYAASLVGARVEVGPDGLGRFVDGRIIVHAQGQSHRLSGMRTR